MEQDFSRLMDKTNKPTEHQILRVIGEQAQDAWLDITTFIEDHYDFEPETVFYGTKYGWTIRYRRSGSTLCSLFPEKGGFTVLITLGKKESEKVLSILDDLSSKTRKIIKEAKQLRDGRWLWIRLSLTIRRLSCLYWPSWWENRLSNGLRLKKKLMM